MGHTEDLRVVEPLMMGEQENHLRRGVDVQERKTPPMGIKPQKRPVKVQKKRSQFVYPENNG